MQGTPDAATMNTTEPTFSPSSMLPFLQGSFPGAYVPANISDPFQVRTMWSLAATAQTVYQQSLSLVKRNAGRSISAKRRPPSFPSAVLAICSASRCR